MHEKIRVFNADAAEVTNSTLVGFSHSTAGIIEQYFDEIENFLSHENRKVERIDTPPELERLRCNFLEISPPLENNQLRKFANLCLKLASNGNNSVSLTYFEFLSCSSFKTRDIVIFIYPG